MILAPAASHSPGKLTRQRYRRLLTHDGKNVAERSQFMVSSRPIVPAGPRLARIFPAGRASRSAAWSGLRRPNPNVRATGGPAFQRGSIAKWPFANISPRWKWRRTTETKESAGRVGRSSSSHRDELLSTIGQVPGNGSGDPRVVQFAPMRHQPSDLWKARIVGSFSKGLGEAVSHWQLAISIPQVSRIPRSRGMLSNRPL